MADKPEETRVNDIEDLKTAGETGSVRLPVPSNDPNDPLVCAASQSRLMKPTNILAELVSTCQNLSLPDSLLFHIHRQRQRQQLYRRYRATPKTLPYRCNRRNSTRRTQRPDVWSRQHLLGTVDARTW